MKSKFVRVVPILILLTFSFNAEAGFWSTLKSAWKKVTGRGETSEPTKPKEPTTGTKPDVKEPPVKEPPTKVPPEVTYPEDPPIDPNEVIVGAGDPPNKECAPDGGEVEPPKREPPKPKPDISGCLKFDTSVYTASNSGEKFASKIANSKNRRETFKEIYGPLAVHLQERTGYPASALLSQWSEETTWGTSKQARVNNNIGGHSCFTRREDYLYPTDYVPEYMKPQKMVDCTYKRPRRERGMYITFGNILDASFSQVYNILDNPKTSGAYGDARDEVRDAVAKNERPDPFKVIDGLEGYAAFPNDYLDTLKKRIKEENFTAFDKMEICDEE